MKSIIVPTDFSASAENAMYYAAQIASEAGASLVLFHAYSMSVGMIDMPVLVISAEEIKNNANAALQRHKELVATRFPGLEVSTQSSLGDVVEEVNRYCDENDIIASVIGTKGLSGIEKFLFGNTAASIIRKSSVPVISVPPGTSPKIPENIVFATDLMKVSQVPADRITSFITLLHAKLHVVHIRTDNDNGEAKGVLLQMLAPLNPTYHEIPDGHVLAALQKYSDENSVDMMIVLPHRHTLFERLFFNLHTEGIMEKMPVPVLCIPEIAVD